jgi:hypothetical protein
LCGAELFEEKSVQERETAIACRARKTKRENISERNLRKTNPNQESEGPISGTGLEERRAQTTPNSKGILSAG